MRFRMPIDRIRPHTSWRASCTALGLLLLLAGAAQADIKITCAVGVSRGGLAPGAPGNPPTAMIVSYKGKMARSEATGGPLVLYEGATGKVYSLDPGRLTYRTFALDDLLSRPDVLQIQGPAGGEGYTVAVRLEKTPATRMIAGKQTQCYLLTASLQPKQTSRGSGRSAVRKGSVSVKGAGAVGDVLSRSGVLSGPPTGGAQARPVDTDQRSFQVTGEYWLADAALLPAGENSPLVPLLRQTLTVGPLLRDLSAQLAKLRLFPLAGSVTARATGPFLGVQGPVTLGLEARMIGEETLDAALFQVPTGYLELPANAR